MLGIENFNQILPLKDLQFVFSQKTNCTHVQETAEHLQFELLLPAARHADTAFLFNMSKKEIFKILIKIEAYLIFDINLLQSSKLI